MNPAKDKVNVKSTIHERRHAQGIFTTRAHDPSQATYSIVSVAPGIFFGAGNPLDTYIINKVGPNTDDIRVTGINQLLLDCFVFVSFATGTGGWWEDADKRNTVFLANSKGTSAKWASRDRQYSWGYVDHEVQAPETTENGMNEKSHGSNILHRVYCPPEVA